jgi:hypothetical protein
MKTPFTFGKIVRNSDFTNRKEETRRLVLNFKSSVNTILISPRRWGKSSLVTKAAEIVINDSSNIRFCFIDMNNIRSEEQFYEQLATAVLKVSSTKIESILENAKKFLGRFIPNLTFSPNPDTDLKLALDWKEVRKSPDEILDLAEKIADSTNKELIICIDEFQNISEFEDPIGFQKKLRAHWQLHNKVTYCLYGSKRHMLMNVFTSPSMPFYKFGDIVFLEKIKENDWIEFIIKRFNETGKQIGENESKQIAKHCDYHPYYVQQLAQQSWLRTEKTCDISAINEAFDALVLQLSMLFQVLTDELSTRQINFLKALINNEQQISSQRVLLEYGLGTSANVLKIKKALQGGEIIDIQGKRISFIDPLYKYWLGKYYF